MVGLGCYGCLRGVVLTCSSAVGRCSRYAEVELSEFRSKSLSVKAAKTRPTSSVLPRIAVGKAEALCICQYGCGSLQPS